MIADAEFLLATVNHKKLLSEDRLSQVFKIFDRDGNGSISRQEIKEFFSMRDQSEEFVQDLIREVDENGDGEVSQVEPRFSSQSSRS